MSAFATRGGQLAVAVAAALVVAIGLAAAGTFGSCRSEHLKPGRPSAAVTSSPHGGVAYATAVVFARQVSPRAADTWGEIRAREFIMGALQQYGYFPRTDEFISGRGAGRVHSANVVAVKEGDSARRLVVGAHYDSAPVGQGYSDNATGVGLLLEVAARVKGRSTPYTIVFVAFGAEEKGLRGAQAYWDSLPEVERDATIGMIDLDAVAGGDELAVMSRFGGPAWLRDDILSAAQALDVPLTSSPEKPGQPAGTTQAPADDLPFANADVATAILSAVSWERSTTTRLAATAQGPPIWNTKRDTVAYVDGRFPGRVKAQLAHLSLLLYTVLTSELKRKA